MVELIDTCWLWLIGWTGRHGWIGTTPLMYHRHAWWSKRRVWDDTVKKWIPRRDR